jgi:predicted signal transduction protein with EAL and GGDEF domain
MACCRGPGQGILLRPIHVRVREIDHFRLINDTCGHEAGDLALMYFTDVLRDCCRKSEVLVRWGGENSFGYARIRHGPRRRSCSPACVTHAPDSH